MKNFRDMIKYGKLTNSQDVYRRISFTREIVVIIMLPPL